MDIKQAKLILKKNFIGPDELNSISSKLRIKKFDSKVPKISFTASQLKKYKNNYILILGVGKHKNNSKLTLNSLCNIFGLNPNKKEPCFYNQDWYAKEDFATKTSLNLKWYLVRKTMVSKTRGKDPEKIAYSKNQKFPTAILCAYTFFSYYLLNNKKKLWDNDFVWCSDKDHNKDRIYIGRYTDPDSKNKSGFNVHRYLSIRSCYGMADEITS
jgi:hypothetical protein